MPADPPGDRVCVYVGRDYFSSPMSGGVWVHGSVRGCVGVIVSEGRRLSPTLSVVSVVSDGWVPGCRRVCVVFDVGRVCGVQLCEGVGVIGGWVFVCGLLQCVTG